jgi:hypothetical protein
LHLAQLGVAVAGEIHEQADAPVLVLAGELIHTLRPTYSENDTSIIRYDTSFLYYNDKASKYKELPGVFDSTATPLFNPVRQFNKELLPTLLRPRKETSGSGYTGSDLRDV